MVPLKRLAVSHVGHGIADAVKTPSAPIRLAKQPHWPFGTLSQAPSFRPACVRNGWPMISCSNPASMDTNISGRPRTACCGCLVSYARSSAAAHLDLGDR